MLRFLAPAVRRTLACCVGACLAGTGLGAQSVLFTAHGDNASDTFGQSIDILGDVNGDGFADLMLGGWRDDFPGKTDAGALRILSGVDGTLLFLVPGDLAGDHMGFGSSAAGDVDLDGFPDICAAADEANVNNVNNIGSAKIVSGATGATLWFLQGEKASDLFGWSAAAAGDVNGDGSADVILGSLSAEPAGGLSNGSAAVYSGATGGLLWRWYGDSNSDQFGDAVGGAGDVNGDGFDDLIIGAQADDNNGSNSGAAHVRSGFDGSLLWIFDGDSSLDNCGASVSGAGDVDLDGFADLIVGSPNDDQGAANTGTVRVFSGASGALLWSFAGDSASDLLGSAVRGALDADGDGISDLVAGAPGDDNNGLGSGSLRVWSGRDGSVLATFSGDNAGDALGTSVGAGADIDHDGLFDVAGGATGDDDGGSGSGSGRAFSLRRSGVSFFGSGTPGCLGSAILHTNSVPTVGNSAFAFVGSGASPALPALVVVGDLSDAPGSDPLALGALLHVSLGSSFLLLLPTASDAYGNLIGPALPIPADPVLAGLTIYAQAFALWLAPCAALPAGGWASSVAASITLQP